MSTFMSHRVAVTALALGILAAPASGPAHAATAVSLKSYALDQLLSAPSETQITFHGKLVTLGALRAANTALLARFQSAGSLKTLLTFGPVGRVPVKGALVLPVRPVVGGSTPVPAATKHVANPAPQGPLDYVAACAQHTVCVYVPPVGTIDSAFPSTDGSNYILADPLLTPAVCQQDGGVMGSSQVDNNTPIAVCDFFYPLSSKQSAFPGSPPALQAQTAAGCGSIFTTQIDPMGAAAVSIPMNSVVQANTAQPMACAIDLFVPS